MSQNSLQSWKCVLTVSPARSCDDLVIGRKRARATASSGAGSILCAGKVIGAGDFDFLREHSPSAKSDHSDDPMEEIQRTKTSSPSEPEWILKALVERPLPPGRNGCGP